MDCRAPDQASGPRFGQSPAFVFQAARTDADYAERNRDLALACRPGTEAGDAIAIAGIAPLHAAFCSIVAHDLLPAAGETGAAGHHSGQALDGQALRGHARLDSVYGYGPDQTPFLVKLERLMRDGDRMRLAGAHRHDAPPVALTAAGAGLLRLRELLAEGSVSLAEVPDSFEAPPDRPRRINRLPADRAVIPDRRNDEDALTAGLHASLLRLHNRSVESLRARGAPAPGAMPLFAAARHHVTQLYQQAIIDDLLPALCDPPILADVIAKRAPLFARLQRNRLLLAPARGLLIPAEFAALAAWIEGPHGPDQLERARQPICARRVIERLPAGAPGTRRPLSRAELISGPAGLRLGRSGLADQPPLWFYLAREARLRSGRGRLGPLASLILAETLLGVLVNDPASVWHAHAPSRQQGRPTGAEPQHGTLAGGGTSFPTTLAGLLQDAQIRPPRDTTRLR